MQAHADLTRVHVATADDQHRVDAQLFRVGNLRFERRGAEIRFHPHHVRAQFVHDGLGVFDERRVVVERDDANLIRGEPEREVARVMLDEKADGSLLIIIRNRPVRSRIAGRASPNAAGTECETERRELRA